jgi:ATP-binding protein involved in chromosome partitioning
MNHKTAQDDPIKKTLDAIKYVLVILSGKGGVGKSTISTNLALMLAEKGYQVGLLDCDMHGPTIPTLLGLEKERINQSAEGLIPIQATSNLKVLSMGFLIENKDDPVIWRGPMKMGAIKQLLGDFTWGPLDYLIIDLPPGTGDEPLSIAQIIPRITGSIIVTTPQDVALISVRKSINFVKKLNIPVVGIIENMSGFTCPHCKKHVDIFKRGGGKKAAADLHVPFLGAIPLDPHIVETGDKGSLFIEKDAMITKSFKVIVKQVEKFVGAKI